MPIRTPFAEQLRHYRKTVDLTQRALAAKVGYAVSTIRKLETGELRPSRQLAGDVARALELDDDQTAAFVALARTRDSKPAAPSLVPTQQAPRMHGLPAPMTSLVGRADEIADVLALLADASVRLVTLSGPGGVGKTRLAIAVARMLAEYGAGTVVWVSLARLTAAAQVLPTIAAALGVVETSALPLIDELVLSLHNHGRVLVLDNFEHVLEARSDIAQLVARIPALRILVTSRTVLRLSSERVYAVTPLDIDNHRGADNPGTTDVPPAMRLFVERIRMYLSERTLSADEIKLIGQICRRLDGLPLAIELAAARLQILSLDELQRLLDDDLRVLARGAIDLPLRHRALATTIAWSYDLLDPAARTLFGRLSVFADGFSFAAADAICNPHDDLGRPTMDVLADLVDNSLVYRVAHADASRFAMLQTLRSYAGECLKHQGGDDGLMRSYLDYYVPLAENAAPSLRNRKAGYDQAVFAAEQGNLRAALMWALAAQQTVYAFRLIAALWVAWYLRGAWTEALGYVEQVLQLDGDVAPALRARVLSAGGTLLYGQGAFAVAASYHTEALALYRAAGDEQGTAFALDCLALQALFLGKLDTALRHASESLALARQLGDSWAAANALNTLGSVFRDQQVFDRAEAAYQESLALWEQIGDRYNAAVVLGNLGELAFDTARYRVARQHLEQAMATFGREDEPWATVEYGKYLGNILIAQGEWRAAYECFAEGVRLAAALPNRRALARCLIGSARVLLHFDAVSDATRLCAAAEALLETLHSPLAPADRVWYDATLAALQRAADAKAFERQWNIGRSQSIDVAVATATAPLTYVEMR